MITPVFQLVLEEGCDRTVIFTYEDPETSLPIDLTGYTAACQIRQTYDGYPSPTVDITLTPTLGGADGTVTLVIPAAVTLNIYWTVGVYDILLTSPGGITTKLVHGFFEVMPSSTKLPPAG